MPGAMRTPSFSLITLFSLASALPSLAANFTLAQPVEFYSDGCSRFPDGSWLHCCVAHDVKYYIGGTREERLSADQELYSCVSKVENAALAKLMYLGVRKGGSPKYNTPYRWGYAWDYGRGYSPVTKEERRLAVKQISSYNCEREMRSLTRDQDTIDQICKTLVPKGPGIQNFLQRFFN